MRDFTKSLFSFTWALSLFGARQAGNLVDPRTWLKPDSEAAGSGEVPPQQQIGSVTDSLVEQLGEPMRQTFEAGDRVQRQIVDLFASFLAPIAELAGSAAQLRWPPGGAAPSPAGAAIFAAHSSAGEQVLISYTRGRGRFSDDRRFIALTNTLYQLDGQPDGEHQGVWQALFSSPDQLFARPPVPSGPMNEPVGPVDRWPVTANTIARWTYADGSRIDSVGPAASHLIPLVDGSLLFLVITAQIVTAGSGRFRGARGLTQSLGATHVPRGVNLFTSPDPTFPALTLDTFKIHLPAEEGRARPPSGRLIRPGCGPWPGGDNPILAACHPTGRREDSKFVEVHGSRMHYLDVGVGEPLVLLHGNPTWSYLWRNVIPPIARGARCIVPDLIGMGASDKPDIEYGFADQARYLEGFLAALGLGPATLVLHDWGVILGLDWARRHEERVNGLVLMEAMVRPYASWNDFPEPLRDTFRAFRTPTTGYDLIVSQNVFVEKLLPGSMLRKLSPAEMECYRAPFRDPLHRRVIWRFANDLPIAGEPAESARRVEDYSAWLRRSPLPKLLLTAEPGAITNPSEIDWMRRHLDHLEIVSVGAGIHFHQEDHPEVIGRAVADWHARLTGS